MSPSRMRERRKNLGIRIIDLARITGLSSGWIWQIENGGRASKEAKSQIARALAMDMDELFPEKETA